MKNFWKAAILLFSITALLCLPNLEAGKNKKGKKSSNSFFVQAETSADIRVGTDGLPVTIPFQNFITNDQFKLTKDGNIKAKRDCTCIIHFAIQLASADVSTFPISGGIGKHYISINDTAVPLSTRGSTFTAPNQLLSSHSHTVLSLRKGDILRGHVGGTPHFGISSLPADGISPIGASATLTLTTFSKVSCKESCRTDFRNCVRSGEDPLHCLTREDICRFTCPPNDESSCDKSCRNDLIKCLLSGEEDPINCLFNEDMCRFKCSFTPPPSPPKPDKACLKGCEEAYDDCVKKADPGREALCIVDKATCEVGCKLKEKK